MTELRLIRTLERIESLKDGGRWSFRQPKKQRGIGGLVKTHWDYLIDEMVSLRFLSFFHIPTSRRNGCELISGRKEDGRWPWRITYRRLC